MSTINILGFGVMGQQLAALFSVLGYKVFLWNRTIDDKRKKKLAVQIKLLERAFGKNNQGTITFTEDINTLSTAITVEALTEDLDLKRAKISELKFNIIAAGFFTNSSSFSPSEIHSSAHALHFFNPIQSIKLVETTCPIELQINKYKVIFDSLRDAGFNVVSVMSNRGFVANYILFREIAAVLNLAEEFGYSPKTLNTVQASLGRSISIFEIINQVGVDVTKLILDNLKTKDPTLKIPSVLTSALNRGILGKKNKTSILDMFGDEN